MRPDATDTTGALPRAAGGGRRLAGHGPAGDALDPAAAPERSRDGPRLVERADLKGQPFRGAIVGRWIDCAEPIGAGVFRARVRPIRARQPVLRDRAGGEHILSRRRAEWLSLRQRNDVLALRDEAGS
jgi:hypothetical protein